MLFPYVRKNTFDAGPPIAKTRIGGIPLLSIAGGITTVTMVASAVSNSASILASPIALAGTLSLFLVGGIFYYVAKAVRTREGLDVSLLFKEIPPE
jgi:hypothetical protein